MFPQTDEVKREQFRRLNACGDCGRTTQKGYVEILEFTHFVEFSASTGLLKITRKKELVRKVTVVVALDLGCGNTKNF